MKMNTVGELIEYLSEFDPETPVAGAFQPSYPLAYDIGEPTEVDGVVYLPEYGNQRYAARAIFEGY